MKKPDINDKKYIYFHVGLMKKMFDNKGYLRDCDAFEKWSALLQANVKPQFVCSDCKKVTEEWLNGICEDCTLKGFTEQTN
jgi:hypothetical protein